MTIATTSSLPLDSPHFISPQKTSRKKAPKKLAFVKIKT